MGKFRSFRTAGGQTTLDLSTAMIAALMARETDLRKATDSSEVFADSREGEVIIRAKALNEYRIVGRFSMKQLPGCCGVVVSYHAQIDTQFRKRGIGQMLLEVREDAARRAGYTSIMATVRDDNVSELRLLSKNGWVRTHGFKNLRTDHGVSVLSKTISEE